MKKGKELINNTFIIALGNFSSKLLSFFLLPLYTTLLSTEDYGIYDFILSLAVFILPVITLLMEESMFRFLIDAKTIKEKQAVISHSFIFIMISTLVFIIIVPLINVFVKIPYCLLFMLYVISSIISTLRNAYLRGLGKFKAYSIINFLTNLLIILFNILFIVYFKLGIVSLLLSTIITNIVLSLIMFIKEKIFSYISIKFIKKSKMKEMVKYSLPLVPNSLSWAIINMSDRVMITSFLGYDTNGIYSVSNKFPSLMNTVYSFFYTAWNESAAKNKKDKNSNIFYNTVYINLNNIMISVTVGLIVIIPFIFNFLIKGEFINSYNYVPILLVGMYFSNVSGFYGGIFSAYKNTKIMGFTTLIGAIINIIINFVLMKYIGLWAACISTVLATLFVYLYRKNKIKKYVKLDENIRNIFLTFIMLLIALFTYYNSNIITKLIGLLIYIIYFVYINFNTIKLVLNIIKRKVVK